MSRKTSLSSSSWDLEEVGVLKMRVIKELRPEILAMGVLSKGYICNL